MMTTDTQKSMCFNNEEILKDVTGGAVGPDSVLFDEVCPYCGKIFYRCDGNKISGKLYCPTCWENKEKLGIPGVYKTENGVGGGW